jgi:hypothetical protein
MKQNKERGKMRIIKMERYRRALEINEFEFLTTVNIMFCMR